MNAKKINAEPIKTILVIVLGTLIIYTVTKWEWALYSSLIIGVLGFISPFLARKIDFLWMKLTWLLSLIVPNILLSLIYYVFLTPVAVLSRLFGKRNQLTLKNTEGSMFLGTNKNFDSSSFEKPW